MLENKRPMRRIKNIRVCAVYNNLTQFISKTATVRKYPDADY